MRENKDLKEIDAQLLNENGYLKAIWISGNGTMNPNIRQMLKSRSYQGKPSPFNGENIVAYYIFYLYLNMYEI